MPIPPLSTDRLVIRPYTLDDLHAHHQLLTEAFDDPVSLDDVQSWLAWTITSYRELARLYQPPYGDYAVTLKAGGEVIGSVGLAPAVVPWDALDGQTEAPHLVQPEFGLYWGILPAHQRRGYASEAAHALVDYVFTGLNARRVVATTEHDNAASQAVMRSLGMTIRRNPGPEPVWCQVVGVLENPAAKLR